MMIKKNNKTAMRVNRDTLKKLEALKIGKETNAEFLDRILRIFGKRGIPREINRGIRQLQEITNTYVCPELHETLELFRILLITMSKDTNEEQKSKTAEVISRFLTNKIENVQKTIEEYQR